MDNTQIEAEISRLELKISKLSKKLYGQKAIVKAKHFQEITQYQSQIDELKKQLKGTEDLYEKDYMKRTVPIKSTIRIDVAEDEGDDTTAVLKSTENEILSKPVDTISGTEVLFMSDNNRIQKEKDYQITIKNTIVKNISRQTDPSMIHTLNEKLEVINNNLSKLEAALKLANNPI